MRGASRAASFADWCRWLVERAGRLPVCPVARVQQPLSTSGSSSVREWLTSTGDQGMHRGILLGAGIAAALALAAGAQAGVVKTKTKSNQSNDRCAGACPIVRDDVATALAAEFDRLDTDGDGRLDAAEQAPLAVSPAAGEAARGAPLKGVDVKLRQASMRVAFSSDLDRNGDGAVDRAEWLADGLAQFDLADADRDGSLTESEAARFGWNVKSSEAR
jgi:hypothetical protein